MLNWMKMWQWLFARNPRGASGLALALAACFGLACVCNQLGAGNNDNKSDDKPRTVDLGGGSGNKDEKSNDNRDSDAKNGNKEPDNGDFVVEYSPVENTRYAKLDENLREERVLENAARDLNNALALPRDLTLTSRDCGTPNAFYNPGDHSLTICYELMEHFFTLGKKQGKSDSDAGRFMRNSIQFVFFHELGHGLINVYRLPVTGREEDAVDQLSTYISLEEVENGEESALDAAQAFFVQAKMAKGDLAFADEHSFDGQRFYNIICWVYGHDPDKYQRLVTDGVLPEQRAQRCPSEYAQLSASWKRLLTPYRK